jgi:hypothetical protein
MLGELAFNVPEGVSIRWRILLGSDIRPLVSILTIEFQPLLDAGVRVGLDRLDRAFGFADAAINALVRMYDEHVLTFVEAVYGADFDTVREFALDAVFIDDERHGHSEIVPALSG